MKRFGQAIVVFLLLPTLFWLLSSRSNGDSSTPSKPSKLGTATTTNFVVQSSSTTLMTTTTVKKSPPTTKTVPKTTLVPTSLTAEQIADVWRILLIGHRKFMETGDLQHVGGSNGAISKAYNKYPAAQLKIVLDATNKGRLLDPNSSQEEYIFYHVTAYSGYSECRYATFESPENFESFDCSIVR